MVSPSNERTLPEPATVTIEQAASRLGIPRSSAYELVKRGAFPCPVIRAGKRIYVSRLLIERLLDPDFSPDVSTPDGEAA
jgi:excisionase family DNA binding protein